MSSSGWTDHHCHLTADDAADQVAEARAAGVTRLVNVGTDLATSQAAIEVAARFDRVHATAGVHPHDASGGIEGLEALLERPEVVAVGECGLDYHYLHSPAEVQREVFAQQIGLAADHRMPLVIHTREAWDETFEILAAEPATGPVVFHCFTGGPVELRRCLDLGAWVSFSGIVTFKSAEELREAARICPLDRMLVETDAPYLAPVPHRGTPNRPALVAVVGEAMAEIVGVAAPELAELTTRNAEAVYGFEAHP